MYGIPSRSSSTPTHDADAFDTTPTRSPAARARDRISRPSSVNGPPAGTPRASYELRSYDANARAVPDHQPVRAWGSRAAHDLGPPAEDRIGHASDALDPRLGHEDRVLDLTRLDAAAVADRGIRTH